MFCCLTIYRKPILLCLFVVALLFGAGCQNKAEKPMLYYKHLASQYFENDTAWYLENIPFFECSDSQLQAVYYYRWKMYKAHIRNTGINQYVITEFINDMGWDRDPYSTINAASMHHIYEGRWLRDDRYMNGYINYLYQQGGNNRSYSESIADAVYNRFLVNGDTAFMTAQLDSMVGIYNQWYDHFDSSKQMYYIPAMPDATEYTIASIDASGGIAGFDGGDAFRPTLNSYMYGNAMAISSVAGLKGDGTNRNLFLKRAADLKQRVQQHLWHDSLQHFLDRFKVNNQYVKYWDFTRGRELAGMAPWYFNLPDDKPEYHVAWKHVVDTNNLLGQYGLRTNEPSYEHYFKQFVYFQGQRGSQWNGPSWPFQTSIALTAMANFLNDYNQTIVTSSDYLKLLRLYTAQHYLPDSSINLVENYDPNLGGPIVYYYWSNHYNHSSFNNLIVSGLCGVRPSASDTLLINPLLDSSIQYFMLDKLKYHGHELTVVYDRNGDRYKIGKGLNIFVDGKKADQFQYKNKSAVIVGHALQALPVDQPENLALNLSKKSFPSVSASVNTVPDTLFQVNDGKIWYFPEITNQWSTAGSTNATDWIAIDFGAEKAIDRISIYPVVTRDKHALPESLWLEYEHNGRWEKIEIPESGFQKMRGNTKNEFAFTKIKTRKIRVVCVPSKFPIAFSEIECFGT